MRPFLPQSISTHIHNEIQCLDLTNTWDKPWMLNGSDFPTNQPHPRGGGLLGCPTINVVIRVLEVPNDAYEAKMKGMDMRWLQDSLVVEDFRGEGIQLNMRWAEVLENNIYLEVKNDDSLNPLLVRKWSSRDRKKRKIGEAQSNQTSAGLGEVDDSDAENDTPPSQTQHPLSSSCLKDNFAAIRRFMGAFTAEATTPLPSTREARCGDEEPHPGPVTC
uniref:Uncharacterized protein n=1 Tax=Solanum tuberosum TaxID=4113 RepID=M1D915_SOLTU